jgi:hypothetical protein
MSFGIPVRNGLGIGLLSSTTLRSTRGQTTTYPILFDFLSGSLDSRITFTRSTTATFVGSNGLVQTAAINAPRFDYDPVTLAAKGLLIEEQRTNLVLRSEEFDNAYWQKSIQGTGIAPVVTANAATAPDGTMTADQVVFASTGTTSGDRSRLLTALLSLGSGTYTVSFWVKAASASQPNLTLFIQSGVNFVTITPTTSWVRYTYTATETNQRPELRLSGNVGTLGTYYIWGAQLELGAFATSYIPTVASTVTRTADIATMTGTNFSSWFNASAGTFVSQFTTSTISGTRTILDANDNTANESIRLRTVSADPFFTVTDGGVDQANIDAGTVAANTTYKMAGAYTLNDFATSIGGGAAVVDTSGTIPTVNQLQIGNSAASNSLNGYLRTISYYNTRLSDSSLQAITA